MGERNKKRLLPFIEGENLFKMHNFQFDISPPQPPLNYPKILYYPLDPQRHTQPRTLSLQINDIHNLKVPCDLSTSQILLNMKSQLFEKQENIQLDEKDQKLVDEEISIPAESSDEEDDKKVDQQKLREEELLMKKQQQEDKQKEKEKTMYKEMNFGGFQNQLEQVFTTNELIQQFSDNLEHPTKKNVFSKKITPIVPLQGQENIIHNLINTKDVYLSLNDQTQKEVYIKEINIDTEQDVLRNYREIQETQLIADIKKRQMTKKKNKDQESKNNRLKKANANSIEDDLNASDMDLFEAESQEENKQEEEIVQTLDDSFSQDPDYEYLNQETDQQLIDSFKVQEQGQDNKFYIAKNTQSFEFRAIQHTEDKKDIVFILDEQNNCYNYAFIDKAFFLEREFTQKPKRIMDVKSLVTDQQYLILDEAENEDQLFQIQQKALDQNKKSQNYNFNKSTSGGQKQRKKQKIDSDDDLEEYGANNDNKLSQDESDEDIDNLEAQEQDVDNIFGDEFDEEEEEDEEDEDEEDGFIEYDKKNKKKLKKNKDKKKLKKNKNKYKDYSDNEDEEISKEQDSLSDQRRQKQLKKMKKNKIDSDDDLQEIEDEQLEKESQQQQEQQDLYLEGNQEEEDDDEEQFTGFGLKPNKQKPQQQQQELQKESQEQAENKKHNDEKLQSQQQELQKQYEQQEPQQQQQNTIVKPQQNEPLDSLSSMSEQNSYDDD